LIFGAPWALAQRSALAQQNAQAVSMIPVTGEGAKYWSRWRGPSGQGLVEGSGYADKWSDTENVVWSTNVPGSGNSSPVVWGDRIFLTTAHGSGKRSVLCFNRRDGKLLWETFGPDASAEHVHRKNGLASSSVAADGQLVYAFLGNQGLLAMDFDGRIAWTRELGPSANYHGPAGSPQLYKDMVILYQDQGKTNFNASRVTGDPKGFAAAFDRRTGKTIWWNERSETVGWGTPVAIRAGGRDEIIVHGQYKVYSYDPASGKTLWTCDGPTMEVIPTPVVGHGLVFCTSGRAGPTLAIRPGGSGDVTDTHVAWSTPRGSPFIPSPLLLGDYLYTINDMASIGTCFEAKTGKTVWQQRLGEPRREGFSPSPVTVDGKLFLTNDIGETFVLKAGPEFELLHVNRLNEQTLASPALVDGRWYFRTQSRLIEIAG
jgi:outer membrane protein assembly factor BamB